MTLRPQWLGKAGDRFERAITVGNSGTTLLQTFIQRRVAQLHNRELGATAALRRPPGTGDAWRVNRRTPGTGPSFVADNGSISEVAGSYAQGSFTYRTLGARGRVTRKIQATGASFGDVVAGEMVGMTEDFSAVLESACFTGSNAADANSFDGLITLAQATSSQIILQTTNIAGDALTLDKLDETIDAVKGGSNPSDLVIFCSRKGSRLLNGLLQANQQLVGSGEIAGGFRVRTYDGVPIVKSTGLPDTMVSNASKFSAFTGGSLTGIVVVNTNYVALPELTPLTVQPLAQIDSQYMEFDLYWDGALAVDNTLGLAILVGLSTT